MNIKICHVINNILRNLNHKNHNSTKYLIDLKTIFFINNKAI